MTVLLSALLSLSLAADPAPADASTIRGPTEPAALVASVPPVHPDGPGGELVTFQVLAHIDETGRFSDLHFPDDAPERFREPARAAIQASTFTPARIDGRPVAGELLLEIVFEPPPLYEDPDEIIEVTGTDDRVPIRAVSDVRVDIRSTQAVATSSASDVLTLAPGVFISRVGGSAEPVQIFLRGFDARHGQDIAFSVDGMPLNEVGNPHGHGLVDLDALLPEALTQLRVVEGPFDPHQGDFAVAGSASFTLGLAEPGLVLKGSWGSFATARAFVGWRHPERQGFFVAGEAVSSQGYGENRGLLRANVLARAEGSAHDVDWHLLVGGGLKSAESAGLVRRVDVDAGRVDLFGTQDPRQGGTNSQGFVAVGLAGKRDDLDWHVDLSAAVRRMELRNNWTGFLTDERRPGESAHDQRGDLLQQTYLGRTLSLDAAVEQRFDGQGVASGALRAGVYGRYDMVDGDSRRLRALDSAPYRTEADYRLDQGNVSAWVDGEVTLADIVTLDAGARIETFLYALDDHCAAKDGWFPGAETDDVNCPDEDRTGPRLRDSISHAQGLGVAPKGSVKVRVRGGHTLMVSVGRGIRSLEALALSNDENVGFGSLFSGEAGWEHRIARRAWTAVHRLAFFGTRVARDLIFDEETGANVLAGETIRWGATAESEVHVGGFTERTTLGWTYARFGDELPPSYTTFHSDRQPGMLVPYVPPVVFRSDLSYGWHPGAFTFRNGLGVNVIAPRPLPQSERSATVFTVDLSSSLRWRGVELGFVVQNLFNQRYPLAEYNFASYFPDTSGSAYPTRVPSRQVSPGPPLAVSATLTVWPGDL